MIIIVSAMFLVNVCSDTSQIILGFHKGKIKVIQFCCKTTKSDVCVHGMLYTLHKKLMILNILNSFVYFIYATCARMAYINYTQKISKVNYILISLTFCVAWLNLTQSLALRAAWCQVAVSYPV